MTPLKHLLTAALLLAMLPSAHAQLYVATGSGVREYTTTGTLINSTLVSGAAKDVFDTTSGLLVETTSGIGLYNSTTGAVINSSFITGLSSASYMTTSGNNLYVLQGTKISEYNLTTGAVVNSSLITGLNSTPRAFAVSGSNIFVANENGTNGTIGEYTLTGSLVTATFESGLTGGAEGLYLDGNKLFVTTSQFYTGGEAGNHIGEYNATTGAAINSALVVVPQGQSLYGLADITGDGTNLYVDYNSSGSGSGLAEFNEATGAAVFDPIASGLNTPLGMSLAPTATPEPRSVAFALMVFGLTAFLYSRKSHELTA